MFLGFFVIQYFVAHKPFLVFVHLVCKTQFSFLSYRWCECGVALLTRGRARRRHGTVRGGHHPHPGTTHHGLPAPVVTRTNTRPGEAQKITETRATRIRTRTVNRGEDKRGKQRRKRKKKKVVTKPGRSSSISQVFGSRVTHGVRRLSFVCAEPKRVTLMSDVARARGLAVRREERRLRAFWRHEIMAVKMATNSAIHHSAQRQTVLYVDTGTQTCTWTYMDSEKEARICFHLRCAFSCDSQRGAYTGRTRAQPSQSGTDPYSLLQSSSVRVRGTRTCD